MPPGARSQRRTPRADAGEAFELALGNTIDSVETARAALEQLFAAHALPAGAVHRLEVVLEELVSNVIRHGFTPGSNQSIHLRCSIMAGLVTFVLEDDGTPFDPLQAPEPRPFDRIETAALGGLGLALVRKLAASFRYERADPRAPHGEGGFAPVNRVTVQLVID